MPAKRGNGDATTSVHGGERRPGPEGSIVFPIYQSTVYATAPGTHPDDIDYIRLSNTPSQAYLHDKLAALERADAAIATASGMSALATILAAYMQSGDHMIAAEGLYGGTYTYVAQTPSGWGCGTASSTHRTRGRGTRPSPRRPSCSSSRASRTR